MDQNGKVSLFQRFRNWNSCHEDTINLVVVVLIIMACMVACIAINKNYSHELNIYETSNYEYLCTVADNIWNEDTKCLMSANLPDNVSIENYTQDSSSGIEFKCYLINDNFVVTNPFITVHISSDFETVEMTYFTENEYVEDGKSDIFVLCFLCCMLIIGGILVAEYFVKFCIYLICVVCDFIYMSITKLKCRNSYKRNDKKDNYRHSYDASKDV